MASSSFLEDSGHYGIHRGLEGWDVDECYGGEHGCLGGLWGLMEWEY